jgi:hypothetical protein
MIFTGLTSKPVATVSSGLASKLVTTVFSSLTSKLVATVFSSMASKLVAIVSPGLISKRWWVFWLSLQTQVVEDFPVWASKPVAAVW